MLGILTRVWVPHSMVISFKLETDPGMLVRKVSWCGIHMIVSHRVCKNG